MLREQPKSLFDEGLHLWSHIANNDIAFEERESAASLISGLTKEDIKQFFATVFRDDTGKLSIQIYGYLIKIKHYFFRKAMQKDILNTNTQDEFENLISTKGLLKKESYSGHKEHVVFNNAQLSK